MIEITAKLLGRTVYVPGENIVCCITFHNKLPASDKKKSVETLAWASAQIDCVCLTNSKVPILSSGSASLTPASLSDTAFKTVKSNDKGHVVFSSKPKIIFCDLQVNPGTSKSFMYRETLPPEAPPYYLGKLVRYTYKITFGTQRVNCPIKLLRVPLRVLAITGIPDYNICEDSEDLSPSNPFLEKHSKDFELGPALQLVQNITARRSPNYYNITNSRGKVGRFCLFKQAYRLGEDIVGTFDFSSSTVPCIQLTVTLQSEEKISEEYKSAFKQDSAIISYSKHHEVVLHMDYCLLNLPIPLHATPAFSTDIISLGWKLHFEFVTGFPGALDIEVTEGTWEAPETVSIETMIWDLPIQIFPTIPTPERKQPEYSIEI